MTAKGIKKYGTRSSIAKTRNVIIKWQSLTQTAQRKHLLRPRLLPPKF